MRSKFELNNITIKNTTSDAFDSDFSSGTLENGIFEQICDQFSILGLQVGLGGVRGQGQPLRPRSSSSETWRVW